jgi:diguanylate cyclase (GGDEF)-like protein/PAS domain S-box-containing protein
MMTRGVFFSYYGLRAFVAVAVLYAAAGLFAIAFSGDAVGVVSIWPGSGVAIAALVIAPPRLVGWILSGIAVGSAACNLSAGFGWGASLAFSLSNTLEPVIALRVARALGVNRIDFERPGAVALIAISCMVSAAASAAISASLGAGWTVEFLSSWFLTASLGQLIFAPLILTVYQEHQRIRSGEHTLDFRSLALSLGAATAICGAVFMQSSLPLLFLPILPVLHATYRHGKLGGALAVGVVAVCSSLSIAFDTGPFHLLATEVNTVFFAQIYLVTVLTAVLPLAATLAAGRTVIEEVTLQKRFFELASQTARIGHWRIAIDTNDLTWSDAMFRIHGWIPGSVSPSFAAWIETYHRDDRTRVARALEDCAMLGGEFAFEARIETASGEIRYVECHGSVEYDKKDEVRAIFGILQDVTERVKIQHELEQARLVAEREARNARQLAATDPLTGIANRRRIMALLEQATQRAAAEGYDLTIAVMDIDHFKSINDRFGHATGDDVLRAVVQEAAKAMRPADAIGRIGGEEFLLVLDHVAIAEAEAIAERIRERVHTMTGEHPELPEVTVSIGLAIHRASMEPGDLFRSADAALYAAKREGRNMMRVA